MNLPKVKDIIFIDIMNSHYYVSKFNAIDGAYEIKHCDPDGSLVNIMPVEISEVWFVNHPEAWNIMSTNEVKPNPIVNKEKEHECVWQFYQGAFIDKFYFCTVCDAKKDIIE